MPPPGSGTARPASWQDVIRAEATQAGLPPELALSVADTESSFNPTAQNPSGARGLFQLMPETAKRLGVDPTDPIQNIRGGIAELKRLVTENKGDVVAALRRYNGSPAAADTATQPYVDRVIGKLHQYQTPAGPSAQVGQPPPSPYRPEQRRQQTPYSAEQFMTTGQRAARTVGNVAADLGSTVDPRTPEGRRNLAGAAGAAGAAALTEGASLIPSVLGAAGGGMLAEAGEQAAGTKPASAGALVGAGAQQGAYETAGQVIPWGVKALGRRLLAGPVTQGAKAGLTATLERAQAAVEAAEPTATQALSRSIGTPPSASAAGREADRIIRGPAQDARDLAGQAVDAAARSGPLIDLTPLKKSAQQVVDQVRPPEQTFPRVPPENDLGIPTDAAAAFKSQFGMSITDAAKDPRYASLVSQYVGQLAPAATNVLGAAQDEAARETLKHPVMKVVNRILNADDQVPFHDLHLWKSELQNSLAGTYDKAQKKQVTSLTEHLTAQMRDALSVHAPYNEATAKYASIVPLYTKEYAAAFRRAAATDPESLVRMIKPGKPTALRMLRDLLVTQSADAGKGAEGQTAWDGVRGAWTHANLLKGGVAKLGDNIEKLPPEFRDIFFGDANGKAVLSNLQQISSAYANAKAAGLLGVKTATEAAERFRASSLGRQPTTAQTVGHLARGTLLWQGYWGWVSRAHLLASGPAEKDLIEWAAYSPKNTQTLVRWMTGQSPTGLTLSNLGRLGVPSTVLQAFKRAGMPETSPVGQPPPR
jgi:hypothetical protein